ncbi:MAG: hypothetical protein ORN52_04365, partial [Beijerinckiaceae bacterium]|nr:hypothetical protein [Beijerinckiaceae bacterium]
AWLSSRFPSLLRSFVIEPLGAYEGPPNDLGRHVAVTWIAGYLVAQVTILIVFRLSNPIEAGRLGLSLTIANMIGLLAQSGLAAQVPSLVRDVEQKDWQAFDHRFQRAFRQMLGIFLTLAMGAVTFRLIVSLTPYRDRLLDTIPFLCLFAGVFITHIVNAWSLKLRSFHKDPLVWIIAIGSAVLVMLYALVAPVYGANGVTFIMLAVQAGFTFPLSWYTFMKQDKILRI